LAPCLASAWLLTWHSAGSSSRTLFNGQRPLVSYLTYNIEVGINDPPDLSVVIHSIRSFFSLGNYAFPINSTESSDMRHLFSAN